MLAYVPNFIEELIVKRKLIFVRAFHVKIMQRAFQMILDFLALARKSLKEISVKYQLVLVLVSHVYMVHAKKR
jgi:hypothetical protein